MRLADYPESELRERLRSQGLVFQAGRFRVRLRSRIDGLASGLRALYADSPDCVHAPFADFTVSLNAAEGLRRWYRPQAVFALHGAVPFAPLPLAHALPLLEWGLNWCASQHCHRYLVVHAAVVEKHGRALILPGIPGAGKSTLCAALVGLGGWRLLSDELTLIDLENAAIHPNPRPISLKNASIDIVREGLPDGWLSPAVRDTVKGTVAHLRPPAASVDAAEIPAQPGLIVFPQFRAGAGAQLQPLPRGEAFLRMADNAFNYSILGEPGFRALARLLDASDCYEYPNGGDLTAAIEQFDALVAP